MRDSLVQKKDVNEQKKPSKWKILEEQIIKPALIYNYEERREDILKQKEMLKLNSTGFDASDLLKKNTNQELK